MSHTLVISFGQRETYVYPDFDLDKEHAVREYFSDQYSQKPPTILVVNNLTCNFNDDWPSFQIEEERKAKRLENINKAAIKACEQQIYWSRMSDNNFRLEGRIAAIKETKLRTSSFASLSLVEAKDAVDQVLASSAVKPPHIWSSADEDTLPGHIIGTGGLIEHMKKQRNTSSMPFDDKHFMEDTDQ